MDHGTPKRKYRPPCLSCDLVASDGEVVPFDYARRPLKDCAGITAAFRESGREVRFVVSPLDSRADPV